MSLFRTLHKINAIDVMQPLVCSCDKSILFIGLACQDIIISVKSYPKEDLLVYIPPAYNQRGGDAATSSVVYALLQNKYGKLSNDRKQIYFMGTLSAKEKSSFIINDLKKYPKINYDLCYYNKNNEPSKSYIFISEQNGSRTIAHNTYKYELTFNQFYYQINNKLMDNDLSHSFNLVFFELKWLKEMFKMIEFIKKKYENKIKVATEIESVDFYENVEDKNISDDAVKNVINKIILLSDIIFLSRQYLTEIGYNDDNPIKYLKQMIKKYKYELNVLNDKIFVIPWGASGAYCVELSNCDNIIFCKSYDPPNSKVIDTLGAGDTFNGSFLFGLRQQWDLRKCCDFANQVAGFKVCNKGIDCIKNFKYNTKNAKL